MGTTKATVRSNKQNIQLRGVTYVTELLVDFACLDIHLHVRQAYPLVQVLAVADFANRSLGVVGRQDLQHVCGDVVLGLGLLIALLVQAL